MGPVIAATCLVLTLADLEVRYAGDLKECLHAVIELARNFMKNCQVRPVEAQFHGQVMLLLNLRRKDLRLEVERVSDLFW